MRRPATWCAASLQALRRSCDGSRIADDARSARESISRSGQRIHPMVVDNRVVVLTASCMIFLEMTQCSLPQELRGFAADPVGARHEIEGADRSRILGQQRPEHLGEAGGV